MSCILLNGPFSIKCPLGDCEFLTGYMTDRMNCLIYSKRKCEVDAPSREWNKKGDFQTSTHAFPFEGGRVCVFMIWLARWRKGRACVLIWKTSLLISLARWRKGRACVLIWKPSLFEYLSWQITLMSNNTVHIDNNCVLICMYVIYCGICVCWYMYIIY